MKGKLITILILPSIIWAGIVLIIFGEAKVSEIISTIKETWNED